MTQRCRYILHPSSSSSSHKWWLLLQLLLLWGISHLCIRLTSTFHAWNFAESTCLLGFCYSQNKKQI
jgi:hypothetical protein